MSASRVIRAGMIPPPRTKAAGMARETAMVRALGEPICEMTEKAGAKKQTATSGWSHIQIMSRFPELQPSRIVNNPVSNSTMAMVLCEPKRSASQPPKKAHGCMGVAVDQPG